MKDRATVRGRLVVVLKDVRTGRIRVHVSNNLVTSAGEVFYAQKGAGEATTNTFTTLELGTAGDAPAAGSNRSNMITKVSGSQQSVDGGYPKTDDDDADNSGSGTTVVSHRYQYGTTEANETSIDRAIVTNATPGASEPVLCYATFAASFDKNDTDTMKIFVNHTIADDGV